MKILEKVKIGNTVKVNLDLSKDRLATDTIKAINNSSICTISDFKITDGMGIGVILKLSNGKEEWFFENEIEILDEEGKVIEEKEEEENEEDNLLIYFSKKISYKNKIKFKELVNRINFVTWLIFSVKDIF